MQIDAMRDIAFIDKYHPRVAFCIRMVGAK